MHLIDCECSERFLFLKHISEVLALTGEPKSMLIWLFGLMGQSPIGTKTKHSCPDFRCPCPPTSDDIQMTEVLNTMYGNTIKKLKRLFPDVISHDSLYR